MLEALTITIREGIEVALIIGIILAYLQKTKKEYLNKYVHIGWITGIALSIIIAILFQIFLIELSESMEGVILLTAGFFVITMIVWMFLTAKKMKKEIEEKVEKYSAGVGIGILVFAFLMVLREGIETVLFLFAISFTALNLIGAVIGLLIASVFGIAFIKGSLRINLRKFFLITSIMLLILVFQLIVNGIHEILEGNSIKAEEVMQILGPLVREDYSLVYLIAMLLVPIIFIIVDKLIKDLPKFSPE